MRTVTVALVFIVASFLFVAGCTRSTAPSASTLPTSETNNPAVRTATARSPAGDRSHDAASPAHAVTTPVAAGDASAGVVRSLGFDDDLATLAASATSTLTVVDNHTFVVHHALADGSSATTAIHLFSDTRMRPGDRAVAALQRTDDGVYFTLTYAIDAASLPPALLDQVLDGLPPTPEMTLAPGLRRRAAAMVSPDAGRISDGEQGTSTLGVVMESAATGKIVDTGGEAFSRLVGEKAGQPTWAALTSVKAGLDAWDLKTVATAALKRVAAIRECAEHPTNPLAQKEYRENPDAQARYLQILDRTTADIKSMTAAGFTSSLLATGSGLIKSAPFLAPIAGVANDYVATTAKDLIADWVNKAEQLVDECVVYIVTGHSDVDDVYSGRVTSIHQPFTIEDQAGPTEHTTFKFQPDGDLAMTGTFTYHGEGEQIENDGGPGTYRFSGVEPGVLTLHLTTPACRVWPQWCWVDHSVITFTPEERH